MKDKRRNEASKRKREREKDQEDFGETKKEETENTIKC